MRRLALPLLAALGLAVPPAACAADSMGLGAVTIPGTGLTVGVAGGNQGAGKVSARFSTASTPLFYGADTTGMNDGAAAVFALNLPSGLYSGYDSPVDASPFTQTSAPVLTGTGGAGDPYVVTSAFDATGSVHITQTITHVSGTTRFTGTWSVRNGGASATAMQAFVGGDTYVNALDVGFGTSTGTAPNRVIGQVAPDFTSAQLVEQSSAPWSHFYSGAKAPFMNAVSDSTFGSFVNTVDGAYTNSGEAVEWDYNLGAGATKTLAVVWSFTHPPQPSLPEITGGPAAGSATSSTSASFPFAAAVSDGFLAQSFQCALDGGTFTDCGSPKALAGLGEGAHTFSVRTVNSAGDPGPQRDRTWTVDSTSPATPGLTGAPTGTVAATGASITLAGEVGAAFRCSVDGSSYSGCASPLVLTGLADGNHVVAVKQYDTAGNASVVPAVASWTVDASVPTAPAGLASPADSTATTATLAFSGLNTECSFDGVAFAACASPVTLTGLSVGAHTFEVRSVSAAGTHGPVSTAAWSVIAPAAVSPTPTPQPTPEAPVKTPSPAPKLTAMVGGQAVTGDPSRGATATVAVAKQAIDVGCKMTGVELASCKVDLYARVPTRRVRAAATTRALVGTGSVEADADTSRVDVHVVLNATGRALLRRSRTGLDVRVAITGKPVSGEAITTTGVARLVTKRATVTVGGFAIDEATLSPAAKRALNELAAQLTGGATVRVIGYTDNSSDDADYLRRLGRLRAQAVKDYLVAHGAKATYTIVTRGAANPRATNTTREGRALNRRVVLRIVR